MEIVRNENTDEVECRDEVRQKADENEQGHLGRGREEEK